VVAIQHQIEAIVDRLQAVFYGNACHVASFPEGNQKFG